MQPNHPQQSGQANTLGKTLLIILGVVALIGLLSCFGCFFWLTTGPQGGVRMANDMEPYAVEYLDQHRLLDADESLISYYDETIGLDGTSAIILTDRRVIHHTPAGTSDMLLTAIEDISVSEDNLGFSIAVLEGKDGRRMKLEFAALNNGDLFIDALHDQHARAAGNVEQ